MDFLSRRAFRAAWDRGGVEWVGELEPEPEPNDDPSPEPEAEAESASGVVELELGLKSEVESEVAVDVEVDDDPVTRSEPESRGDPNAAKRSSRPRWVRLVTSRVPEEKVGTMSRLEGCSPDRTSWALASSAAAAAGGAELYAIGHGLWVQDQQFGKLEIMSNDAGPRCKV